MKLYATLRRNRKVRWKYLQAILLSEKKKKVQNTSDFIFPFVKKRGGGESDSTFAFLL